ncbi:MAG: outer membrane protein [uncultured bacterium]|nr:MAG: outer membrane protein [uncultured bacterium]
MKTLKHIVFIGFFVFLFGCSTKTVYQAKSTLQTSPQAQISLLDKRLIAHNVRVIQDNDSVVLVLPNKTMFNNNSANFTDEAYKVLDLIFGLTKYYEKSVISVTGFTENSRNDDLNKAMAAERAHRVVQYLWNLKIDASFMYAGARNMSVAKNNKLFLTDCVVINFRILG